VKDWSKERWRKLYLHESAEQRGCWNLTTRCLRDYLIRIAEDDGLIVSRGGIEHAFSVLDPRSDEADLVLEALFLLVEDGFLRVDGAGAVYVTHLALAQGDLCTYCGNPTIPGDRGRHGRTVDHVIPRCQGGSDDPSNLVIACRGCNSRKGGRTPEQARVNEWNEQPIVTRLPEVMS
jgi:hypothetical protein